MIANFFNETKPINFVVLSAMMMVAFVVSVLFILPIEFSISYIFKHFLYLLVVIFMLFVADFIIRKNALTEDNTIALFFYVIFFGLFPETFNNGKLLIANLFLLFSFRKIYSLRTQLKTNEKIFDSAIWIGIACMFYTWSFLYLALLYLAMKLFHKTNPRSVFIPIIGFITPIFISYVYLLVTNQAHLFVNYWELSYSISFPDHFQLDTLVPLLFVLVLAIISVFPTTQKSFMAKLDFKSTWYLLLAQIGISLFIVLISTTKNGSEVIFLFFPISVLFANYIQGLEKYWLKESILIMSLLVYIISYAL